MEETIGYEALFSAEEWDSIDLGTWETPKHTVTVWYPPGESDVTENSYELECDVCKLIGAAGTLEEAEAIARLHESLRATALSDEVR
ncbi:MAG: hypothetical protein M3360_10065 [Actinomycetota bacterium]|nr:hypothetical protein [Actinomycetota bacterium]